MKVSAVFKYQMYFICMQLLRLCRSLGEGQCRISVPNVFLFVCSYRGYARVQVKVSGIFQDQIYFHLYAVTEVTHEDR